MNPFLKGTKTVTLTVRVNEPLKYHSLGAHCGPVIDTQVGWIPDHWPPVRHDILAEPSSLKPGLHWKVMIDPTVKVPPV